MKKTGDSKTLQIYLSILKPAHIFPLHSIVRDFKKENME